jgi:hypothetical protein
MPPKRLKRLKRPAVVSKDQTKLQRLDTRPQSVRAVGRSCDATHANGTHAVLDRRQTSVIDLTGDGLPSTNNPLRQTTQTHPFREPEGLPVPVIDLTGDADAATMTQHHTSKGSASLSRLLGLPTELQSQVLRRLTVNDLRSVRCASRQIYPLATDVLGKRCFTHLNVLYDPQHGKPTESQRQLALVLASGFRGNVTQITFDVLDTDLEKQLEEKRLKERRQKEELKPGYKRHPRVQHDMRRLDYSGLEDITILHRDGQVLDFAKVVSKATRLKTFRLHGVVPSSWRENVSFHSAPPVHFEISTASCFEADEVLGSFSTTNLSKVNLFYVKLSMHHLIGFLKAQQRTTSTLVLHCSTLSDGQWPDLVFHIHHDLTSLESLSIKTLYISTSESFGRTVLEKVPDLELDGRESVETGCRSLIEGTAALVLSSSGGR